jgi:hypothetical protein
MRALLGLLMAAALVVGCYGDTGPGPTPGSMDDVIGAIVLQGITVQHLTSGDAGCSVASLHENAVHMTLVIGAQSASHEVYLLNWKNQAKYDAAATDFAACMADFQAHNPQVQLTEIDAYPWRAYGPGWTSQLYDKLANAFTAVDGTVSATPSSTP